MTTQEIIPQYYRKSRWIVGVAVELIRKGTLGFFMDAWRDCGDLAPIQIGNHQIILAVHPDYVRHISITNRQNYDKLGSYDIVRKLLLGNGLVSSNGALWRRQRKLMAPFFTPKAVEQYYDIIVSDGLDMVKRWEGFANTGQTVEMINEMMRVTASIILRSMFSTLPPDELVALRDSVGTMIQYVGRGMTRPFRPPLWFKVGENAQYLDARQRVHGFIGELIAARRAQPQENWPNDLLSKLMAARDPEDGSPIPDDLLRDESITIFFAGHETTARTLTFMFYALAKDPELIERAQHEVDSVLGDRVPTAEDLPQLPYLFQVIKETLRLYPPVPLFPRDAVGPDTIAGFPIPAGAQVMLLPYATHRHPGFWEDPERFDPDRWTEEREKAQHPFAYHPFASGQRICIGNNFALFEAHLLAAILLRRFSPRLEPRDHVAQIEMAGTLSSKNGVPMVIEKR